MEAMTSIPATLRKLAQSRPDIQKDWADLTGMADAIDAHLAQPAQAVDVGESYVQAMVQVHEQKNRALSGEKAGPVGDGWKDESRAFLAYRLNQMADGGPLAFCAETLRDAATWLASPTPDKEGA